MSPLRILFLPTASALAIASSAMSSRVRWWRARCWPVRLKRGPRMMARLYRRDASVGLAEVLSAFNLQELPRAVLDYGAFRANYKGLSTSEINSRLPEDTDRTMLPQIVHTAPAEEYYSAISRDIERERAVVAIGFNDQNYTDDGDVVWLAAEIESKLETDRETAEAWCKRLRSAAEASRFANYRIWLVSPEGFTDGRSTLLVRVQRHRIQPVSGRSTAVDMLGLPSRLDRRRGCRIRNGHPSRRGHRADSGTRFRGDNAAS